MTERVYFDITDIVRYAVSNDRVSGMQRVQFNLIGHLVRKHGGQVIRCVFFHSEARGMVEIDPTPLFGAGEYDSSGLLQHLDLEPPSQRFPSRSKVKSYLRAYNDRKLLRAVRKLDVYASALFMPRRLKAMGLQKQKGSYAVLPMTRIEQLPEGGHFVPLSTYAAGSRIAAFANEHVLRGGDMVQLVHDLIPQVCPQFMTAGAVQNYQAWLEDLVRLAPRVLCVSESTAHDLRAYIGPRAREWDIRAVPLAHEFDGFPRNAKAPPATPKTQPLQGMPFVLCVGTLEIRKNGMALLRAWSEVVARLGESAPMLVFAGKHGWLIKDFEQHLAENPALTAKVMVVDAPSDAELAWLYAQCLFMAYPSFYEGWGLPVGEAAWFGKYVIASRTSSIPEVCGDLIDYTDPHDPADIARQILRALNDPPYVKERERGIRAAPLRQWSDVADDIFNAVMTGGVALRTNAQAPTHFSEQPTST